MFHTYHNYFFCVISITYVSYCLSETTNRKQPMLPHSLPFKGVHSSRLCSVKTANRIASLFQPGGISKLPPSRIFSLLAACAGIPVSSASRSSTPYRGTGLTMHSPLSLPYAGHTADRARPTIGNKKALPGRCCKTPFGQR